jgi:hypothetical protein
MANEFVVRNGLKVLVVPSGSTSNQVVVWNATSKQLEIAEITLADIPLSGTQNSVNKTFTIPSQLSSGSQHMFFINGQLQTLNSDYSISGTTLTIDPSRPAPTATDVLKLYGNLGTIGSFTSVNNNVNNNVLTGTGTPGIVQGESNMKFDGSTLNITGDTTMTGTLTASSKSFDIPHPLKSDYRLRYGALEGPEYGVYFRGKTKDKIIKLPEYWSTLVDISTTTVHLTSIGSSINHFVVNIEENSILIDSDTGEINTYFIVYAERKDIEKILLEYKSI